MTIIGSTVILSNFTTLTTPRREEDDHPRREEGDVLIGVMARRTPPSLGGLGRGELVAKLARFLQLIIELDTTPEISIS